jgi:hypothetical protein
VSDKMTNAERHRRMLAADQAGRDTEAKAYARQLLDHPKATRDQKRAAAHIHGRPKLSPAEIDTDGVDMDAVKRRFKVESRAEALGRRIGDLLPQPTTEQVHEDLYRGDPTNRAYSSGIQAKIGDRVKKKIKLADHAEAEVHGVLTHQDGQVRVKVTGGRNIKGGAPVGNHYDPTGWQRHEDEADA